MSHEYEKDEKHRFINNIAKELYGYDDATLQKEMDEAEAAWEQQKAADPEAELQSLEATQSNFKVIMGKIVEQGIKSVSQNAYAKRQKEDRQKVVKLKTFLKIGVVAAALYLLLMGMAMDGLAFKKFGYRQEKVGTIKNKVVWSNEVYQIEAGSLDEAYQEIKEKIGIRVVVLGYMPPQMRFKELYIDRGNARIIFNDDNNMLYLRETKYSVDHISEGVISDPEHCDRVYNKELNCELLVQENVLENGQTEYWTEVDLEGSYYWLSGIVDKEEFIKIIENLKYYE